MVAVMDNLAAHKGCGVKEALQAAGCRVVYLPPYLPDMSSMEPSWSKAKSVIRMLEARTLRDLGAAVTLATDNVTAENCLADCRYALRLKEDALACQRANRVEVSMSLSRY